MTSELNPASFIDVLAMERNPLVTLGRQQVKGRGKHLAPSLSAALLPDVDNENAKVFPAGFHFQDKPIAIMQHQILL